MLSFDKRHLAQMASAHRDGFMERLLALLRQHYGPTWLGLAPADQRQFADRVVQQAPRWGFEAESDIAELAMLLVEMRLVNGHAPMPAWFAQVVNDTTLVPAAKLYQLIHRWHQEITPRAPAGFAFAPP